MMTILKEIDFSHSKSCLNSSFQYTWPLRLLKNMYPYLLELER